MKKRQDAASGITLNISHHFQLAHVDRINLHLLTLMYQADPFGDTGKEHCRLSSLLPISDYSNGSSFVHNLFQTL